MHRSWIDLMAVSMGYTAPVEFNVELLALSETPLASSNQ